MNRITLYILRQSLGVMLFVTLGLTAAVWLIQSLKLIELVVDRGAGIGLFLKLAVLAMPQLLQIILPIGCFIGVLFAYSKMISDSELIVMRACGLSQWMLAKPALILAAAGTIVMMSLSVYFLPASKNAFKDLQFAIRNQFTSALLQEGTFNNLSDTLTVYVRAREAGGELQGLLIQDLRDPQKPVTYTAERGVFARIDDQANVVLFNGSKQVWDKAKKELSVLAFEQSPINLDEYRDAPGARTLQADERYLPDLFDPSDAADDPVLYRRLVVEGHNRVTQPFYCLSYILVALACLLPGELNRRGHGKRLLVAYALVAVLQALALAITNLAAKNLNAVPLLYLLLAAPILGATYLLAFGRVRRPRLVTEPA